MSLLPHPATGQQFPSPVPPGIGWPGDPADADTPAARSATVVRRLATSADDLDELAARESVCAACPRLVSWREQVAREKRLAYAGEPYWGRPIPGWGDPAPRIAVVGLAPGAHGANRTGRNFTGDQSGDWIFARLHRAGLASQAESTSAADGLRLLGTRMIATVRCAPPANKPTPTERDTCAPWLERELRLVLPTLRVVLCLGGFGWDAAIRGLRNAGVSVPRPKPTFGHAREVATPDGPVLLGCFHPSQHNTYTGRLTEAMGDAVVERARSLAGLDARIP